MLGVRYSMYMGDDAVLSAARKQLRTWTSAGNLRVPVMFFDGLKSVPQCLQTLLDGRGEKMGKTIIRVSTHDSIVYAPPITTHTTVTKPSTNSDPDPDSHPLKMASDCTNPKDTNADPRSVAPASASPNPNPAIHLSENTLLCDF